MGIIKLESHIMASILGYVSQKSQDAGKSCKVLLILLKAFTAAFSQS